MSTQTAVADKKAADTKSVKYVYSFGDNSAEGNGKMKDVLGGKGAGLAEMTNAKLPVPPGFTIQTEACREYMRNGGVSKEVNRQMDEALDKLEKLQGQKLGGADNPLLVSGPLRRKVLHARHDGHHPQPRPQRQIRRRPRQAH